MCGLTAELRLEHLIGVGLGLDVQPLRAGDAGPHDLVGDDLAAGLRVGDQRLMGLLRQAPGPGDENRARTSSTSPRGRDHQ